MNSNLRIVLIIVLLLVLILNLVLRNDVFDFSNQEDSFCTLKFFASNEEVYLNNCASFAPDFCLIQDADTPTLVPNCELCGCRNDEVCNSDGHCIYYYLTSPSIIKKDIPFNVTFKVLDERGYINANHVLDFEELEFKLRNGINLTRSMVSVYQGGAAKFEMLISSEGTNQILVYENSALLVKSNPINVRTEVSSQILWGDIHVHCFDEDKYFCHTFEYAHNIYDLDFVSETNADFGTNAYNYKSRYEQFKDKIIIFPGVEWVENEEYAHALILFYDINGFIEILQYDNLNSLMDIWNKSYSDELITITAHPTVKKCRFNECKVWSYQNDSLRPLAEIYSGYAGSFECFQCPFDYSYNSSNYLRNAWSKNYKIGVVGTSDSLYPGNPKTVPAVSVFGSLSGGLTAVVVQENTKEAVWNALKHRHTYATSGSRMILDFRINDEIVGSQLYSDSTLNISVFIAGEKNIDSVNIFKYDGEFYNSIYFNNPNNTVFSYSFIDQDVMNNSFYYIRATQEDGNTLWSSPIWVN
ncbi:DUF3604 domain-containing protein [archaeon]|nr:DUF3604 domain-containing protein [archaeon]